METVKDKYMDIVYSSLKTKIAEHPSTLKLTALGMPYHTFRTNDSLRFIIGPANSQTIMRITDFTENGAITCKIICSSRRVDLATLQGCLRSYAASHQIQSDILYLPEEERIILTLLAQPSYSSIEPVAESVWLMLLSELVDNKFKQAFEPFNDDDAPVMLQHASILNQLIMDIQDPECLPMTELVVHGDHIILRYSGRNGNKYTTVNLSRGLYPFNVRVTLVLHGLDTYEALALDKAFEGLASATYTHKTKTPYSLYSFETDCPNAALHAIEALCKSFREASAALL